MMNSRALVNAAKDGDHTTVKRLMLQCGVDDRHCAIRAAILYDKGFRTRRVDTVLVVQALLEYSGNDFIASKPSYLALACQQDNANEEMIKVMIDHGCCNDVQKALEYAVCGDYIKAIPLLVKKYGADVNRRCPRYGQTVLWNACSKDCISALLDAGVDPTITDDSGTDALYDKVSESNNLVTPLVDAGCDPLQKCRMFRRTSLQSFYRNNNSAFIRCRLQNVVALVAAGDRSWQCVPTPCPGLEKAMLSVWKAAPDELPEVIRRMENPPQSVSELFPRLDDEMKRVVHEVLRGVNKYESEYLKKNLLNVIFGFF